MNPRVLAGADDHECYRPSRASGWSYRSDVFEIGKTASAYGAESQQYQFAVQDSDRGGGRGYLSLGLLSQATGLS